MDKESKSNRAVRIIKKEKIIYKLRKKTKGDLVD
jgi:hypothetical protein